MILKCNKEIEIKLCKSFKSKLCGLMFKKGFKYGICLKKCNSIHTFFMKENIDIIMTDKNNKIIYIKNNLSKNKMIWPKRKVYYTYELPANYNTYKINEYLQFK